MSALMRTICFLLLLAPAAMARDAAFNFNAASAVSNIMIGPAVSNGDADGDGTLNVADLTAIHNQLAGIVPPPLAGDGDIDNDNDVDATDADLLRDHLVNGTPLP